MVQRLSPTATVQWLAGRPMNGGAFVCWPGCVFPPATGNGVLQKMQIPGWRLGGRDCRCAYYPISASLHQTGPAACDALTRLAFISSAASHSNTSVARTRYVVSGSRNAKAGNQLTATEVGTTSRCRPLTTWKSRQFDPSASVVHWMAAAVRTASS